MFTTLLDLSWISILFLFTLSFVSTWLFFASIWYLIITISDKSAEGKCVLGVESFSGAILFSIETQQTIGYGTRSLNESCVFGIFLVVIQSCFGLLVQAIWVGIVYTRLSRPRKRRQTLIWSHRATVSIRNGKLTLQIRLGDMRQRSTLVEAHVRMYFVTESITKEEEIIPIHLIDMNVGYNIGKDRLFLSWPILIEHVIDEDSPLYRIEPQQLSKENFEILIVLEGSVESTGMITQVKSSYLPSEIIWAHRFIKMISLDQDRTCIVDYGRFHEIIPDNHTPFCSAENYEKCRNGIDYS